MGYQINKNRHNHGFTLIEILVVLMIVGVIITFAFMGFGDFGAKRRIELATSHLYDTIQFAKQYARLTNKTIAIGFKKNEYQILVLQPGDHWNLISGTNAFNKQYLPDNTVYKFESVTKYPQIIINSLGNNTPFKITLGSSKTFYTSITGNNDGTLQRQ